MSWFDEQIRKRDRLEADSLEEAYADLASSVVGRRGAPRFAVQDARQADNEIETIMRWLGIKPVEIPASVTGFDERLEYQLRPSGVAHRRVRLEGNWYRDATGAMLGRLTGGETVALLPHGLNGYAYIDPASGKKVRVTRRTASNLQPDAICFYHPLPLRSLKVKDLGTFIMRSLRASDYALVIIATLVVTIVGLLPAWMNQLLFSQVIPSGAMRLVLPMAILLVGVTLSQVLINIDKSLIMARTSSKLDVQMEAATMARLVSLEPRFFKTYSSGDLTKRTMTMASLSNTIVNLFLSTGLTSVFSLVYIAQIATFTPQLTIPALLVIIADVGITTAATFANMRYNRRQLEADAKCSGVTTALLSGLQKIKLAGAERRAFARWSRSYAEVARNIYDRPRLLKVSGTLSLVIGMLGNILIYWFAGTSQVSAANYMAFNVAYGMVVGAISSLASIATSIAQIKPTMELVEPILKAVPEKAQDKLPVTRLSGSVEVTNVSFRYRDDMPAVFDGLSLKVNPGEYVGIVGKTGCGKSTLMRLLLGFENPSKGAIYYDGMDITKVDLQSLRRNMGVVLQDGKLFLGDIYSNITIGAPWLSLDEAWEAAEIAGIADDIHKMPMGMRTVISEGSGGISGGQRQRLLIARAIAARPRVLMLDEATSALDNITQRRISDALASLECTRIVIAHRLSTIRQCDRIIVVDQGHIAEDGTYEELIGGHGLFADLVERQRLDVEA